LNDILHLISQVDPIWVYLIIFLIAFIENIFPPSPSDIVVVFGGALASIDRGNFFLALNAATFGSTLGFITVYTIGNWFGKRILEEGKIKFFPREQVLRMEGWFNKYGYWLIVANRFLAGTRAVVSFFAGVSHLEPYKTTLLSFVSSLAWYTILVYAGYSMGKNWKDIEHYLERYSEIATGLVLLVMLIGVTIYFIKKKKSKHNG